MHNYRGSRKDTAAARRVVRFYLFALLKNKNNLPSGVRQSVVGDLKAILVATCTQYAYLGGALETPHGVILQDAITIWDARTPSQSGVLG